VAAAAAAAADDGTTQLEHAFDRLELDPPTTVGEAAETVVAGLDDAVAALRELVVWPRLYAAVRPSSLSLQAHFKRCASRYGWNCGAGLEHMLTVWQTNELEKRHGTKRAFCRISFESRLPYE
jgi:hypothetical protein